MPGRSYDRQHVDACRQRVAAHLEAYRALSLAAAGIKGSARTAVNGALVGLEPRLFNSLVVVLDACLPRRPASAGGGPLAEVRALAEAVALHGGVVAADAGDGSVLGHRRGDVVDLTEGDFRRLSEAYFDAAEAALGADARRG